MKRVSLKFLVDNNYVKGVNRSYSINYFPASNYIIKNCDLPVDYIMYGQHDCKIMFDDATTSESFDYSTEVFELYKIVPVDFKTDI